MRLVGHVHLGATPAERAGQLSFKRATLCPASLV